MDQTYQIIRQTEHVPDVQTLEVLACTIVFPQPAKGDAAIFRLYPIEVRRRLEAKKGHVPFMTGSHRGLPFEDLPIPME